MEQNAVCIDVMYLFFFTIEHSFNPSYKKKNNKKNKKLNQNKQMKLNARNGTPSIPTTSYSESVPTSSDGISGPTKKPIQSTRLIAYVSETLTITETSLIISPRVEMTARFEYGIIERRAVPRDR